jgi:hypothetical protein
MLITMIDGERESGRVSCMEPLDKELKLGLGGRDAAEISENDYGRGRFRDRGLNSNQQDGR